MQRAASCRGHVLSWLPFCVLALLVAVSCAGPASVGDEAEKEESPDVIFVNFSRDEVENGIVVFSARAERAEYFKDRGELVIHGLTFEDRGSGGGEAEATGMADKAVYHEDTGDAEFSGFVQLYSREEDATFETTELKYVSSMNSIEGGMDNPVAVRVGRKLFLRGTGFFADIQEKAFSFRGGVSGSITSDRSDQKSTGE